MVDAFAGTDDETHYHDVGRELYVARLLARHMCSDVLLSSNQDSTTLGLRFKAAMGASLAAPTTCIVGPNHARKHAQVE
jgi:hypothetical protein